jgi:hypothetical protein
MAHNKGSCDHRRFVQSYISFWQSARYEIVRIVLGTVIDIIFSRVVAAGQHIKNMDMRMNHSEKMTPRSTLKPAQRPSVEIIYPKTWQIIKGDSVPIEFQSKKGKIGETIHVYVGGEMA